FLRTFHFRTGLSQCTASWRLWEHRAAWNEQLTFCLCRSFAMGSSHLTVPDGKPSSDSTFDPETRRRNRPELPVPRISSLIRESISNSFHLPRSTRRYRVKNSCAARSESHDDAYARTGYFSFLCS